MSPVAIVTGAARGIGAAAVKRLNRDGWAVAALDACRDDAALAYPLASEGELNAVVADCADPSSVLAVVADVRDPQALDSAVAQASKDLGEIDAAVAVAGVLVGGSPLWELPEDAYRVAMEVNLDGVWNLARSAVPRLLARPEPRRGRFVAVTSAAAHRARPQLAPYGAAKAGVEGLIRGLAADLGRSGVTANAISPGSTTTRMLEASAELYELGDVEEFAVHHLQGRLVRPEEVAAAVAWLCGSDSSAVTGSTLHVDAGMSA